MEKIVADFMEVAKPDSTRQTRLTWFYQKIKLTWTQPDLTQDDLRWPKTWKKSMLDNLKPNPTSTPDLSILLDQTNPTWPSSTQTRPDPLDCHL